MGDKSVETLGSKIRFFSVLVTYPPFPKNSVDFSISSTAQATAPSNIRDLKIAGRDELGRLPEVNIYSPWHAYENSRIISLPSSSRRRRHFARVAVVSKSVSETNKAASRKWILPVYKDKPRLGDSGQISWAQWSKRCKNRSDESCLTNVLLLTNEELTRVDVNVRHTWLAWKSRSTILLLARDWVCYESTSDSTDLDFPAFRLARIFLR